MIEVTKINNVRLYINSELIESIEKTPDTTITMVSGKKYIVKEKVSEIVDKAIDFKRVYRS